MVASVVAPRNSAPPIQPDYDEPFWTGFLASFNVANETDKKTSALSLGLDFLTEGCVYDEPPEHR
jgi:hypothetical protein